jgi:hypothetical protein
MYYYIKNNNIIYKSKDNLQHPPFSFDIVLVWNFKEEENVVYENWILVSYYCSELYKKNNWLDIIEKENKNLKQKLDNQEKIVKEVINNYETLKLNREILIANIKKND